MLKTLRASTKVIMWIVAVAFVGWLFFTVGMDILTSGGNVTEQNVGRINGQEITWQEYYGALSTNRQLLYRQTGNVATDETEQRLLDDTWESLVGQILLRQEADPLGIQVTDADVLLEIQYNPPAEVRSFEIFQTHGRFDPAKYQQALADPRVDWRWLEDYVRTYLPQRKMQQRVWASVVVTEGEVRSEFARRYEKVKISYVRLGPEDFRGEDFSVTSEEIAAFYEAHPEGYRLPARAAAQLVRVPKTPSEADTLRAERKLRELREELAAGEAFEDLVIDYSDDASASRGGNIGWIEPDELREEPLRRAVRTLREIGDVTEPVMGERGYYLFELMDRREDVLHLRQILVAVYPGRRTLAQISGLADDLRGAVREGALTEVAAAGADLATTALFEEASPPPELAGTPAAVRFCFEAAPGDVSPILESDDAFIFVRLSEYVPERQPPLTEVRGRVAEDLQRAKRREIARETAEDLAREAVAAQDLDRPARKRRLQLHREEAFSRYAPPPDLAAANQVLAMAFALAVDQVSPVVEEGGDYYVIQARERVPADEDTYAETAPQLRGELVYLKRQEAFAGWFQQLRDHAEIVDLRGDLYAEAPAEEEEPLEEE